jgi:hypothetical protein
VLGRSVKICAQQAAPADFYSKDVVTILAPVNDEQLQRDFREANEKAISAVKEFAAWLASQESSATDDSAIGPQKFSQMLKMTEQVDIQLDELAAIGCRDLERNRKALADTCEKFAPGKTIAQCMILASAHKPKDADPVIVVSRQLAGLREFIIDNDIVTIPGTEQAMVKQAPASNRQFGS